jgi:hypothetical protein
MTLVLFWRAFLDWANAILGGQSDAARILTVAVFQVYDKRRIAVSQSASHAVPII